jgi:hypothetical protein
MANGAYNKEPDRVFQATYSFTLAGSSGTQLVQFKTGTTIPVLLAVQGTTSTSSVTMELIETPTITNGTTAVASRVIDRNSANTAVTTVFSDPTSVSGGTTLFTELIPASNQGSSEHQDVLIRPLKASTSYVVKFTNLGNSSPCLLNIVWYE